MKPPSKTVFLDRSSFAEVAEALGVGTDQIACKWVDETGRTVVYWNEGDDIFNTRLERDADGVFVSGFVRNHTGSMTEYGARLLKMLIGEAEARGL